MTVDQFISKPTRIGPYRFGTSRLNSGTHLPGERSQRASAMRRGEEARLDGESGCPLGLERGEPPLSWRSLRCSSKQLVCSVRRIALSRSFHARHGVMIQQRLSFSTGEVPRRPRVQSAVTPCYKFEAKGGVDASVWLERSLLDPLQGCQQRQSTLGLTLQAERQNPNRSVVSAPSTGPVSASAPAPLRPDRTSSCQPGGRISAKQQSPRTGQSLPTVLVLSEINP